MILKHDKVCAYSSFKESDWVFLIDIVSLKLDLKKESILHILKDNSKKYNV
jgi:hypothetical protein